jgi:hypothetical protein
MEFVIFYAGAGVLFMALNVFVGDGTLGLCFVIFVIALVGPYKDLAELIFFLYGVQNIFLLPRLVHVSLDQFFIDVKRGPVHLG